MSTAATGNSAKMLIRPEALEGKSYARLAHPLLVANPSLFRPLLVAAVTSILVLGVLGFTPLTTSYRGYGVVSAAVNSTVVRATRPGQVVKVASQGERTRKGEPISFIEQPVQTDAGRNPAAGYADRLRRLADDRDADIKLLTERYTLSMSLAIDAERALIEQIKTVEKGIRNQAALVSEAEAMTARLSTVAGHVTRLDALALAERTVGAQNRLLDLQAGARKLNSDLTERTRSKRVLEIDHAREQERLRHQFQQEEAALLEKAASHNFVIPSPIDGEVLAVYKRPGDWVTAGDEIAIVGERSASKAKTLSIQVPGELANLLAEKQPVRVWPNGIRRSDSPLVGTVEGIEQRTPEGYRVRGQQPGGAPGSFVAHVSLDEAQRDFGEGVVELRVGSEVEMEIVFGTKPLYEALLPRRLTKSWARSDGTRK
jgi:biotin carboxyl carrier protein